MKDGVGQLTLTLRFPEGERKDGARETQGDGSGASIQHAAAGSQPTRAPGAPPRGRRKWHSLIDKVYAPRNLQSAWARVRANRGAPGVDGMTIDKFAEDAHGRLQRLAEDLRAGTYRHQPVRRVLIPKSGGGQRPLGIPTVTDRVVQQALRQVLEPIFEAKFLPRSHGFRPGRGCATALRVVDQAVRHGYGWVVDADLRSFFDTVDHERLIDAVAEEVADGSVLRLIRRILGSGVRLPSVVGMEPTEEPTEQGTPQGGPVSPLLANIYLHGFDVRMEQAGYGVVRYADDFVVFARSESEAAAALQLAREILEGQLGLRLHPEKTRVVTVAHGFEFLGFHYYHDPKHGLRKEVRRKSAQRFREAVRVRTPRLRGQRLPKPRRLTPARLARNQRLREMIRGLNRLLRGWHWYFKGVWRPYAEPFLFFDSFVRRRLRSAITGRIGMGWWHSVLPNRLLEELGLVPLNEWHRRYLAGDVAAPAWKGRPDGEPYAGKPHVRFG